MYKETFENGIKNKIHKTFLARKIYITFPTFAFKNNFELQFDILNAIAEEFNIPITTIQVVGSSKTGFSYIKDKDFVKGKSDLDIAIIDPLLFQTYAEIVLKVTDGLRNLSKFPPHKDYDSYKLYISHLARGFFRPDLMPACEEKKNWFNFFNLLSQNYIDYFSDINAGIYFSQVYFEYKQSENIQYFKKL